MKIVEIFKSIDGEGIRTGRIVTFVRTFGCCCSCTYCDSMYANEVTEGVEIKTMSVMDIVKKCLENKTPYVTLTGGEPLIQKDVENLVIALLQEGFEVNIETSGAVDIQPIRTRIMKVCKNIPKQKLIFTVDYKSISSGCNKQMILSNFTKNMKPWDVLKFVVGTEEDLNDMNGLYCLLNTSSDEEEVKQCGKDICHFFVSPIFGMIEPKDIVKYIMDNNMFNMRMQLQLHKYIWDPNMKGV